MPDVRLVTAEAIRDRTKRVMVILGAGASADAGIPTGAQVGTKLGPSDRLILRNELGGAPDSWKFFDIVDVLAKFRGQEGVQQRLQDILKPKFISLGYEILAHYLHRQLISVVVSLNHDDAFDRSLELESPNFQYQVRSRSEFGAHLERLGVSESLPSAYLKVHGCVSRKMTFRIDRGSVAQLEPEKLGVLRRYLEKSDLILCLGWSMHDADVFRPLAEVLETKNPEKALIVVDRDPTQELSELVTGIGGQLCNMDSSSFLSAVGDRVEGNSRGVGLHRHRVRALCFGEKGPLWVDEVSQAAIEIVMFALKARAQTEPRVLFECSRTSLLLARAGKPHRTVTEEAQVRALAEILDTLCNANILTRGEGDTEDVYWLTSSAESGDADEILRNIAKNFVSNLVKSGYHRDREAATKDECWQSDLEENLTALTTAFDVDLIPRASDFAMFSEPQVILSKEDFQDKTRSLLKQPSPQKVLCVSTNTGEWILDYIPEIQESRIKHCRILVEDYDVASDNNPFKRIAKGRSEQVVAALREAAIKTCVKATHNKLHQLTAILDENAGCASAIYFRRERKSTRIAPVFLTGEHDLKLIGRIWKAIWCSGRRI